MYTPFNGFYFETLIKVKVILVWDDSIYATIILIMGCLVSLQREMVQNVSIT